MIRGSFLRKREGRGGSYLMEANDVELAPKQEGWATDYVFIE